MLAFGVNVEKYSASLRFFKPGFQLESRTCLTLTAGTTRALYVALSIYTASGHALWLNSSLP